MWIGDDVPHKLALQESHRDENKYYGSRARMEEILAGLLWNARFDCMD